MPPEGPESTGSSSAQNPEPWITGARLGRRADTSKAPRLRGLRRLSWSSVWSVLDALGALLLLLGRQRLGVERAVVAVAVVLGLLLGRQRLRVELGVAGLEVRARRRLAADDDDRRHGQRPAAADQLLDPLVDR